MPSFVKIPNIRKWALGIEGSIILQPHPLSLAAWQETDGHPRSPSRGAPPSPYFSIHGVNFTGIPFCTDSEEEGNKSRTACLYPSGPPGRPPGGTQHSVRTWGHRPVSSPPGKRLSRKRWVNSGGRMNPLSSTSKHTFNGFKIIFYFLIKMPNI